MTKRYEEQGHARYLTFGCFRRKHLFRHGNLTDLFVRHLNLWRRENKVQLWAFVVMSNHVHLLVHKESGELGNILRPLKSNYAREALAWLREHMPDVCNDVSAPDHGVIVHRFWQSGGGYDRNIYSDDAVLRAMEYIHNNPVRVGLVQIPEDYYCSSARFWLSGEADPLRMDIPEWWKEKRVPRYIMWVS